MGAGFLGQAEGGHGVQIYRSIAGLFASRIVSSGPSVEFPLPGRPDGHIQALLQHADDPSKIV